MKDWVGVLHWGSCLEVPKKELLLFDRVAVVHLESAVEANRGGHPIYKKPDVADQLESLEEQGLLTNTPGPPQDFYMESGREPDLRLIASLYKFTEKIWAEQKFGPEREFGDGRTFYRTAEATPLDLNRLELMLQTDAARISLVARTTADYITSTQAVSAVSAQFVPEMVYQLQAERQDESNLSVHSDVAQVVLSAFPEPDELTSIEDILAFKRDSEARQRLLELRIWIREMAKAELRPVELEEKLEWLLHEYRRHLELHHLKSRQGTLETVVTTTLEIAEDLVKIKWSEAAKALFSIRRRKLALLGAEASAPGREVSYVAWAKDRFTSSAK
jgi:hypothetical protein